MLIGHGADGFAEKLGLEMVEPSYFRTEERWRICERGDARGGRSEEKGEGSPGGSADYGTVGAVALDRNGNLAAGTSTGGHDEPHAGRVGDSPVIGAGTYCDNATCGVSCTGYGELFIREGVAHEVVALMKYKKLSVREAAAEVFGGLPEDSGGLIALDARGNVAMPFNSEGMYRGYVTRNGKTHVAIYRE